MLTINFYVPWGRKWSLNAYVYRGRAELRPSSAHKSQKLQNCKFICSRWLIHIAGQGLFSFFQLWYEFISWKRKILKKCKLKIMKNGGWCDLTENIFSYVMLVLKKKCFVIIFRVFYHKIFYACIQLQGVKIQTGQKRDSYFRHK